MISESNRTAEPDATLTATPAMRAAVEEWAADKSPLPSKILIAATRSEVAALNAMARAALIQSDVVRDEAGVELPVNIRDAEPQTKRFAPGDRVVFTKNDRDLGVTNGATGTVRAINIRPVFGIAESEPGAARPDLVGELVVELDDAIGDTGGRDKTIIAVPAAFGWFDLAYCLTNHKSQGRTVDSAHVLVNPAAAAVSREWSYVAASRSRFATTLYVDAPAVAAFDPESHLATAQAERQGALDREQIIEALARSMSKSRAKETTLDYRDASSAKHNAAPSPLPAASPSAVAAAPNPELKPAPANLRGSAKSREPSRRSESTSANANTSPKQKAKTTRVAKDQASAPTLASPHARRRVRRLMGAKPARLRNAGPELGDEPRR